MNSVVIKGLNLFSIIGFYRELPEKLYGGGQVRFMNLDKYQASEQLKEEFELFYSKFLKESNNDLDINILDYFDIANQLFLNPIQKLKIINNKTTESREAVLLNQIRFLKIIMAQEQKIENQFYPN